MLSHNGLLLHGEHVPLLSGEMHFWRVERDSWRACLRSLKTAGLPIVSTYVSWRRHCLAPGEHDLTGRTDPRLDLRAFLELCASVGLWAHLKPGPWVCAEEPNGGYPDWLIADLDLQALDSSGLPVKGYNEPFRAPIPSCLHPKYLEHAKKWLTDVDDCVRDLCYPQGPVALIQLDNEPSMTFHDGMFESDYHPVNVGTGGAYHHWLARKYGSIEALNAVCRTGWTSFESVQAPRSLLIRRLADLRQYFDWVEFKEWLLCRHIESLREMHLQNGIRDVLFTVNYNRHDPMAVPNNWSRLEQSSGLGGLDYYVVPPLESDDLADIGMGINYSLAVSKIPWAPEMMAGIWKIPGSGEACGHLRTEDLEYLYFVSIAFGLKGMNFYMMVNRENWESAPVSEDGRPSRMFRAPRGVVEVLERIPDFANLSKRQELAVMYYRPYAREAYVAKGQPIDVEGHHIGRSYREFRMLYAALLGLNYDPGIVDLWANPNHISQFRLVFVPSSRYMDQAAQRLLLDYAVNGGTVVFCPDLPRLDLDLERCALLGTRGAESKSTTGDALAEYRRTGKGWIVRSDLRSASGGVDRFGPDLESLRAILGRMDVTPSVQVDDPGVITITHHDGATEVLFVINVGSDTLRTCLRFGTMQLGRLVDVLSGEVASAIRDGVARVTVPGRSVRTLFVRAS